VPAYQFLFKSAIQASGHQEILAAGDQYGRNEHRNQQKVQLKFVSANPTGPLHVGHGRGAAVGTGLARLLDANGWDVTREFYLQRCRRAD